MTSCLEQESSIIREVSEDTNVKDENVIDTKTDNKTKILHRILETQVSAINSINNTNQMEKIEQEGNQEKKENQNNDNENRENCNNTDYEDEGQNKEENQQNQETSSDIDEAKVRSRNKCYNKQSYSRKL